jgi:hypothetical protein
MDASARLASAQCFGLNNYAEGNLPIMAAMLTPRASQPCRITMFIAAGDLQEKLT